MHKPDGASAMDKQFQRQMELLFALIENSRRSDRELSKILKISQPTVSRHRTQFEREGFIREYTLIPDLVKMDFDFAAITFLSFSQDRPDLFEEAMEWTKKQPSIIYAASGEGMNMNSVMVSVHRDYASYSELLIKLRRDWQPNLKDIATFMISLKTSGREIKPLSFKYLEQNRKTEASR